MLVASWHDSSREKKNRQKIIQWLLLTVEHLDYNFRTFDLALRLVDYYAMDPNSCLDKLELIAMASLFISSKYEEVTPIHSSQLLLMKKQRYSKEELLDAESTLLITINFRLLITSPSDFLDMYTSQHLNQQKLPITVSKKRHLTYQSCQNRRLSWVIHTLPRPVASYPQSTTRTQTPATTTLTT